MADLRVVDLDFDNIKTNLKNFLKNQDYFTDYDFNGSGLSILLDMLAYDTHYKAYLANMVINERFIDTAVKRASVISHAKALGYVPTSARSAKAIVDITVYGVSPTYTMSLDKFTQFTSSINGASYTFQTTKSYTTIPSGDYNSYTFSGVELYEGTPITYNYVAQSGDPNQLFKIPALNVDTTTLDIVVQNSATDTTSYVYTLATSVSLVGSTDRVFYLEEGTDGYFYVYFGDNILGKSIESGNVIKMTYLVTNGDAANTSDLYAQTFTLGGTIAGYSSSNVVIAVQSTSNGGAGKQSTNDVRFLAPKNYSAQGRSVTVEDYKALLKKNFPEIDSIVVWGGEENTPPIYGKVFIAIKPVGGFVLSSTVKEQITTFLRKTGVVSIQVQFVDPDFTFVSVESNVRYNSDLTTKSSSDIATGVNTVIQSFFANNLGQFDKNFYISKLQSLVDATDSSILGNSITIGLQKRIEPVLGLKSSYSLYFNNKITPYSIYSSAFQILLGSTYYTVTIKDTPSTTPPDYNGTGILSMVNTTTGESMGNIGTVDYASGLVTLTNMEVSAYPSTSLYDVRVNCKPQTQLDKISNTIVGATSTSAYIPVPQKDQILMLDDSTAVPGFNVNSGLIVNATPTQGN